MKLTDRQQQLLDALRDNPRASIRELQATCNIPSTSTVRLHLLRLAERGLLTYTPGKARAAVLVERRPGDARAIVERARLWAAHDAVLAELIRKWDSR